MLICFIHFQFISLTIIILLLFFLRLLSINNQKVCYRPSDDVKTHNVPFRFLRVSKRDPPPFSKFVCVCVCVRYGWWREVHYIPVLPPHSWYSISEVLMRTAISALKNKGINRNKVSTGSTSDTCRRGRRLSCLIRYD